MLGDTEFAWRAAFDQEGQVLEAAYVKVSRLNLVCQPPNISIGSFMMELELPGARTVCLGPG